MSFLDVQDLATVAAQADLWHLIARWFGECDVALDTVEVAAAAAVVALLLKRRKPIG